VICSGFQCLVARATFRVEEWEPWLKCIGVGGAPQEGTLLAHPNWAQHLKERTAAATV
jgi:hypothetical protein